MNSLNQKFSVVEKVTESVATDKFTPEEVQQRLEKFTKEDLESTVLDPLAVAGAKQNKISTSKTLEATLKKNKEKNSAKGVAKNVDTYLGRSNAHLLKHQRYVADKGGADGVILIGTTEKPSLWIPDKKFDTEISPVVLTHTKRMILDHFVKNFRQCPEHFKIDHLTIQNFDTTVMDDHMTASLIIDDLYWNAFSERVPRDMRGTHFFVDEKGIMVTDNNGYHTLSLCVRMSLVYKKELVLSKKELLNSYKATAASMFIDFKMKNQSLILSNCREPFEPSFPIRIQDEHIIPARNLEDGEEVTSTGVILTPLVSALSPRSPFGSEPYLGDVDSVPMVPNMDIIRNFSKSASEFKEGVEILGKGVDVKMDYATQAAVDKVNLALNDLSGKLDGLKMSHEVKHSFDVKSIFSSAFDSCLEKIKTILPESQEARDVIISVVIAMVYLWAVKTERKKFMYLGLALCTTVSYWTESKHISTFCATLFSINAANDLIPMLVELFSADTEEEEAVVMGDNSALDAISKSYTPSVFVGAIVAVGFGVLLNIAPNPFMVFSELTFFNKALNGLEMTYQTIADLFIQLVNSIGSPWGIKIFRSCYTKYPEAFVIIDSLNAIKDKFLEGQRVTKLDYDKFRSYCVALDELDKRIPMRGDLRVYKAQVDYGKRLQAILEDKFKILGIITGGVKAATYVTTLVGDPGLGKSVLSPLIMNAMAPIVLPASDYELFQRDPKSFLVHVNPSNEYQEGVKPGHVMYIVDDFLQMKNKNCDPKICHANWLVRFNNNAEEVVNKAFGDKGTVFYNPKYTIINTNVKNLFAMKDQISTNNINAPARRCGDVWEICIDEEYREYLGDGSYRLDEKKVTGLQTDFYTYSPMTYLVNEANGEVLQAPIIGARRHNDFIKISAKRYLSHHVHQEIVLGQLKEASSNPNLTPWPGMSGLEIAMSLCDDNYYESVPVKYSSAKDVIKLVTDHIFSEEISEKLQSLALRPWISTLEGRSSAFILEFLDVMSDDVINGLQSHISEVSKMSQSEFKIEIGVWKLRYTGKTADEILAKEGAPKPKSVADHFSVAKRNFLSMFKGMADVEPMYDSNPEFFDHFVENKAEYSKWISESGMPFQIDANLRIMGSRIANPTESLDLLFHAMRQTFVAVSSTARRLVRTMVDVVKAAFNAGSWKSFISDPYDVVCAHLSAAIVDLKAYGSDMYTSVLFGLPFSGHLIAGVAASIVFVTGYMMTDALEMVSNSVLKVKFHPKAVRPSKSNVKKGIAKPVIHVIPNPSKDGSSVLQSENCDFLACEDISMIDNARVWNSQVKAIEDSAMENNYSLVYKNMIVTTVEFLRGHTFLVNDHSVAAMLGVCVPGSTFQLVDCRGQAHDVLLGNCSIVRFEEVDFSTVTLYKSTIGPRADIVKKHVTKDQLNTLLSVPNIDCILIYYIKDEDGTRKVYHVPVSINTKFIKYGDRKSAMLVYEVEGHKSSCMSPLIVCDDRFKDINGIIGYHTAGNKDAGDKTGAATAVTQELIQEMLDQDSAYVPVPTVVKVVMERNSQVPETIPIVGYLPPLTQAMYGKIVRTPFHGFMCDEFGVKVPFLKQPSISMPYSIEVDDETITHWPLYNVLETFNNPTPAINDVIAGFARAMFTRTWDRSVNKLEVPEIWSNNDAINGRDLVGPDSRKSSVGQALRYRGITKTMMYGTEGIRDLTTPLMISLLEGVDSAIELLKHGVAPDWKFLGFIKSELVSPGKVQDGVFRFIWGVEWEEHIVCKRLFGHVLNMATRNSIRNGTLIGMNPYSSDADVIGKILEVFCLLCDGDYKWFDKRFFLWLFMQFSLFCRHVYYNAPEEEHVARDTLLMKLASPEVIVIIRGDDGKPIGVVLKLNSALSSGHTLTQLLGCFGNALMIRYTYLMAWCKSIGTNHLCYDITLHPKPDIAFEEDNMHTFLLGDDNIIAMAEERYGFNCLTIQDYMGEINVVYTPSDKSARFVKPWKSVGEASILRRLIIKDVEEGRYLMEIEEGSILGALYFTECMRTFNQTIDTMLQEASLKGRVYFTRFVFYLRERAQEIDYQLISEYLDYEIARKFVLNTAYLPWGGVSSEIFYLEDVSSA